MLCNILPLNDQAVHDLVFEQVPRHDQVGTFANHRSAPIDAATFESHQFFEQSGRFDYTPGVMKLRTPGWRMPLGT